MVCVHPVTEVLFSIYRRKMRKEHPGLPDRLHFHSLVKRRYVARSFGYYSNDVRNSITVILTGMTTFVPVILASIAHATGKIAVLYFVGSYLGYIALYARTVHHHWCSPINFLLVKPLQKLPNTWSAVTPRQKAMEFWDILRI